ncbi:hypothetical protein BGZ73_007843 [Actinomortierella ambigua]|nr:hypothetical protein BGZ73_007843 [Actinomortierella ambigua]
MRVQAKILIFSLAVALLATIAMAAAAPAPVKKTSDKKSSKAVTPKPKGKGKGKGTKTPVIKKGQTAAMNNVRDFCWFLPPVVGGNIAANEDRAVAFCTRDQKNAPNANIFPAGFIQSAHWVANTTNHWVQVTGRFNPDKYKLSRKDGGGQYDIKAPVGSKCAGYNYYVNMVEPDTGIYCMRCCANKLDCPVNKSTYGCKHVLGGNYA